jgi:hemolysin III
MLARRWRESRMTEGRALTAALRQRDQTLRELRADAAVHVAGLAFAAVAAPAAVIVATQSGGAGRIAGAVVYAATLVAMLAFSAAYNILAHTAWSEALRRLDHAAIYLKIAGSYTPFAVAPLAQGVGPGLLLGVWSAAALGCLNKLFAPRRFERASVLLYLALGWAFVLVFEDARASMTAEALALVAVGGGLYTVGVGFHLWRSLRYQNAIWHALVLSGTGCIFAAVMIEIA